MSMKLVKMERSPVFDELVSCCWRYEPIGGDKEGWEAIAKVADGVGKIADVKSVWVLGPDHGDKEFSDIGEKQYKNGAEMLGDYKKLEKDGNYSAEIMARLDSGSVPIRVQINNGGIDVFYSGEEKEVKLISTAIKKEFD